MKNRERSERHVALALKIFMNGGAGENSIITRKYAPILAAALAQVEREALASKVVFPTDEEIAIAKDKFHKDHRKEMGIAPFCDEVEKWIVRFIRSQLKLAPNEPEVKAPTPSGRDEGFEDWFKNKAHGGWAYDSYRDFGEDCWQAAFRAGQKSKAATLKLPDKKCNRYDETDDLISTTEVATHNSLLDKIIKLNPNFKIQVILDAVKSMSEGDE